MTLSSSSEHILREEFNRWAEAGKGESMETEHRPIVEPTLELMRFAPAPEIYTGRWFHYAAELAAFRREGALLVHGTKS